MDDWIDLISKIKSLKNRIRIALVGKYVDLHDAYISVAQSLTFAGYAVDSKIDIDWVSSEVLSENNIDDMLKDAQGIIVPGGFGNRGIEGKILAINYARTHNIPFLGICLGMQLSLIEYARNVLKLEGANSTEFDPNCKYKIIDYLPDQYKGIKMGGTMRLGEYDCELIKGTKAHELYQNDLIRERHRHRYEFNNEYRNAFNDGNLVVSGVNPQTNLVEIIELKNHPFFVASQFHPEFLSRPLQPHPLFLGFITASKDIKR